MNIQELLSIIKRRIWLILICVVISTVTTVIYRSYNYVPVYQASTKIIVNKTVEMEQLGKQQMDLGAIGINISLINTYTEILKTPAIMNKVVQSNPDLNVTTEQLMKSITVSTLNGTQVITLGTIDTSYERAAQIVNAVTEVFQREITKIMKVDNVTILNKAEPKDNPIPMNQTSNQYILISLAVSLIIAFGITFLLEFLDDTLKKDDDVRQIFGAPTLAVISRLKQEEVQLYAKKTISRQVGEVTHVAVK
jgi:capsular polysaccharide biosynthesis protein